MVTGIRNAICFKLYSDSDVSVFINTIMNGNYIFINLKYRFLTLIVLF